MNDYQKGVEAWMIECFGYDISRDLTERNHRFLEEALELVQATGCTRSEAHQLVEYVYNRPIGKPEQEVGGVMVTLAALCTARAISLGEAAETELSRVWGKIETIRAKQAAKPKHGPLPETPAFDDLSPQEFRELQARGRAESRSVQISDERLAEIMAIPDEAIDTSDIPEATEEWFAKARRRGKEALGATDKTVWVSVLDKVWVCRVDRTGGYTGQLTVRHPGNNRVILDVEVGLAYGAVVGPDVGDVRDWQERAQAAVDAELAS